MKTAKTAKSVLTLTVAQFLKCHPTGVGKVVQFLWVPADSLGRDAAGRVVIAGGVHGSTSANADALCVCLSRGAGNAMKILTVGGLGAYGLQGIRESQRRPGELYLGDGQFSLTVKIGKVNTKWRPATLGEALPGALVRVQEKRNATTPNLSRSQHLMKRNTPLMYDGTGLPAVYVGNEAFVQVDSKWSGYEVVPQHFTSSLKPNLTPERRKPAKRRRRAMA